MTPKACCLFFVTILVGCFPFSKPSEEALPSRPTTLDKMVQKMARKLPKKPLRVALGSFTYQNSQIPSSFAPYLSEKLSATLSRTKSLEEFPRDQLNALLAEQDLSQGDLFDENSAAKIGKLKGVQAILTGSYWNRKATIEIFLRLIQVATGKNLATISGTIPKNQIPKSVLVEPIHYKRTKMVLTQFAPTRGSRDFKIRVWVDRGKGATYRVGDELKVKFRSNRDCYLKLYSVSAKGEVSLIFPYKGVNRDNQIQRDLVYTIPGEGANFHFRMARPLGTEVIRAVASTTPFKEIEDSAKTLGQATKRNLKKIAYRNLVVEVDPSGKKADRAEDVCIYTIVE